MAQASNSWSARLASRRNQTKSPYEEARGPQGGVWMKITTGLRRPSQNQDWSRGYNYRGVWQ